MVKYKKIFFLILLSISVLNVNAENYILSHSGLLDLRAIDKINIMGNEVQEKLNIQIFLDVKGNNGIDLTLSMQNKFKLMKKIENKLIEKMKALTNKEFMILSIALDQKHTNILYSNEQLKKIVDKNDVLDSYVIPLLAAKDKNILKSKVSAASLNGFAQIADSLAHKNNIQLESSIGSQGKTASTIWRVFMYTMVIIGILAYFFIILKEKKAKKNND